MDTFFEQIVSMKRTGAQIACVVGIVLAAIMLLYGAFILVMIGLAPIGFLLACGICWASYKLIMRSSIEYEYIFTNGDLDVDKIIAKSSRKRMVSISCSKVERYGKYNPAARVSDSVKKVYIFCNPSDENAKFLIAPNKKEGMVMMVFSPDERVRGAIEKAIPRIAF